MINPGYFLIWKVSKLLSRRIKVLRKPCKYHFSNLLVALAYHPARIRHINDFAQLNAQEQSVFYEWLIAQEPMRCSAIAGTELLAPLAFWQNQQHEIDFVATPTHFIEVKRGACSALEFGWFPKIFGNTELMVINKNSFNLDSAVETVARGIKTLKILIIFKFFS